MSKLIKLLKGSKLTDNDRASVVIRNYIQLQQNDFLLGFITNKALFVRLITLIYKDVFNKAWIVYPQPHREFPEIIKLVEYNEDEIVLFLKHRCWNYRKLLNSVVKIICDGMAKDYEMISK